MRDAQRRGGNVGGEDARASLQRQSDRDRARACADIHDNIARLDAGDGGFHQMLGFRARNQHIGCHAKIPAIKLLATGDVLGRLAVQAFVQVAAVVNPGDLGQIVIWMRVKIGAIVLERVHQKNFGGEARRDDGFVLEELVPWRRAVWMVKLELAGGFAASRW